MDSRIAANDILYSYVLQPEVKEFCDIYFLMHWSGKKLVSRISRNGNTIVKEGIHYCVQWTSLKQMLEAFKADRVALSFRRQKGATAGFVIPKIIYGDARPLDSSECV